MPQRMESCRDRGGHEARARMEALEEQGKEIQTHLKEQSTAKGVVGELPLLGAPGAIQVAVPNYGIFVHAGVNVQSQVPRGSHLEVDGKAGNRAEDGSQQG